MQENQIQFRTLARKALERAKQELASNDDERLKYAALELRLCLEALTYDRTQSYKDDIHPLQYEIWQPGKLIQMMLEINPYADQGATLRIEKKNKDGTSEWIKLGTEVTFSLKEIKENYNALGSFLHMPTLKQISEDKKLPLERIRERCNRLTEQLEAVVTSTMHNLSMGSSSEINCENCGEKIVRRLPLVGDGEREVSCFNCEASYDLVGAGKEVRWYPKKHSLPCPVEFCDGQITIWENEIGKDRDRKFPCAKCKALSSAVLRLEFVEAK